MGNVPATQAPATAPGSADIPAPLRDKPAADPDSKAKDVPK
jgi:hypothetical protein